MADQSETGGAFPSMPPIEPESAAAAEPAGPPPTPVTRAVQLVFAGAGLGVLTPSASVVRS
mgnify:CR=1 FL=1